jgi:hypothetical protein
VRASWRCPLSNLGRDGTLVEDVAYLNHAERFRMFPSTADVRHGKDAGLGGERSIRLALRFFYGEVEGLWGPPR